MKKPYPDAILFERRSAGGGVTRPLGIAYQSPDDCLWRFYTVRDYDPASETMEGCLPALLSYPDGCESRAVKAKGER